MKNWYFDTKGFKKELTEFIYWKIEEDEIDNLGFYLFEILFIWLMRLVYVLFFPIFLFLTILTNMKRKKL